MPHSYTCPTIPQNLRKEETYVQIAEALNYLSDVSEDIFRCVNTRISSNRDKLRSITVRIQTAKRKIQRISTAKHAVQIFSSSKYPAEAIETRSYQPLFSADTTYPIKRFEYQYKPVAQTHDDPVEKLEFYHEPALGDTLVRLDGLGEVPRDSTFIGDILFYNSGKNAYKQSVVIADPLEGLGKASGRPRQAEVNELNLGDAPQSIAGKNATDPLQQMRADSYFYFPDIGDVPTLDVPLDLPDLPGIADDVHYSTDNEYLSIAPSLQHAQQSKPARSTTETVSVQTISEESKIIISEVPEVSTMVDDTPQEVNNEPEDESLPNISQDVGDVGSVLPKPVFSSVDDPHATLMDAIRKAAGGRNLRASKAVGGADAGGTDGGTATGDLMTDLHAKLHMRRKGISGTKGGSSGETVMDKISGMIPPPSCSVTATNDTLTESATTEDDEWED